MFGTNSAGLAIGAFSTGEKREVRFKTYGPSQGVSSTMVAALAYEKDRDRLWIGGASGLTVLEQFKRSRLFVKL